MVSGMQNVAQKSKSPKTEDTRTAHEEVSTIPESSGLRTNCMLRQSPNCNGSFPHTLGLPKDQLGRGLMNQFKGRAGKGVLDTVPFLLQAYFGEGLKIEDVTTQNTSIKAKPTAGNKAGGGK